MTFQIVPESAPFSPEQRAWLNGFLAGMLGVLDQQQARGGPSGAMAAAASLLTPPSGAAVENREHSEWEEEVFPWHDSSLPIVDRMQLAEGRPIERKMMAAMAQLDCGSCGYLCRTYAEAIADGVEKNLTLCSPGGSETAKMLRQLNKARPSTSKPEATATLDSPRDRQTIERPGTRNQPVLGKWLASEPLNRPGSVKDTRHVAIDLTGTGLSYRVGDAMGIWPRNCQELVSAVLTAAALDSRSQIPLGQASTSLAEVLSQRCLRAIPMELVERAIERVRERPKRNGEAKIDATLSEQLAVFAESEEFDSLDLLEFFVRFPNLGLTETDLVELLAPIRPRLYSIASSQSLYPEQVHLTVGRVESSVRGRLRKGVASTMLADRLQAGQALPIFVQPSHGFTVPADPDAPMIMVGPGTGIAPFIAFLQQRSFDSAAGKNWLFFGDQRRSFDFLYQDQLQEWLACGLLTRLDLAFSRDGIEKHYVQHKMKENGEELFSWLDRGGYFFVCGDASRMAADVDRALIEIIAEHGRRTPEQARQYVAELARTKRYMRDVY